MASFVIAIIFSIFSFGNNPQKQATIQNSETTYYLIRHAEKDLSNSQNQDPLLTEAGENRAENWAEIFADVKFDAIYSTNYKRTIATAKPTANAQNLEIQIYDGNNLYSKDFKTSTNGKTVLVLGHQNTTPNLANAILKDQKHAFIDADEHGMLIIVKVSEDGKASSEVKYYN